MIFRAVFSIALLALLLPHEPDLGLGRPRSPGAMSPDMAQALPGSGLLGGFGLSGRSLGDVRAEIEAAQRARGDAPTRLWPVSSIRLNHIPGEAPDALSDRSPRLRHAHVARGIGDATLDRMRAGG